MKFWIFVYYRLQKKRYHSHLENPNNIRKYVQNNNHSINFTLYREHLRYISCRKPLCWVYSSCLYASILFFFHTYPRLSHPTAEIPPIVNKFIRYWYIFFSISRHKFPCCRLQFYHPTDHIVYTDFFIRGDVCGSVAVENILLSLQFQPSYHNATGSIPLMCLIFFKMKLNQFAISHHLLFTCQQQSDKNLWTLIFSLILILFFS